jgi:long-chain acyl-CoA synthetase
MPTAIPQFTNLPLDAIALDDLVRKESWRELDDRVTRMARMLADDLALAPDDHIAALMDNRLEGVELVLAAMLAGVWLTPINHHLAHEEIAYVARDSGAKIIFADAGHARMLSGEDGREVIEVGDDLNERLAAASDEPIALDGRPGGTMIYTSGTTGHPKGVKRKRPATLRDALETGAAAGRTISMDGSGPHLVTGPLHHAAPLLFAVYDMLCGAPVVVMPRWNEEGALRLIEERAIRHTHLVPTMFVRLLRLPDETRAQFDSSSIATVLHGAAPIAPQVKRKMIDWWGPVLVEYWGATESGVATLVDSRQWLDHPGSVGAATSNFEVFAADDDGNTVAPGVDGTLYIRSKRYGRDHFEYHRAAEKTSASYLDDAFSIGDIGRVEADGYVYLADRKSNTIISGGVNIYPTEIENVLQQNAQVGDVAVFGIPDDEWGEQVKAVVEPIAGVVGSAELAEELRAFAREHLAAYKVPRSIDFETELPRHPTGKLFTRLLRDRYWKDQDRKI